MAATRAAYCERLAATDKSLGADPARMIRQAEATGTVLEAAAADRFALLFDGPPDSTAIGDLAAVLQASLGAAHG